MNKSPVDTDSSHGHDHDHDHAERGSSSGLSEQMRRELADFLRTRREKLKPEQVGLAQTSRRRTPGLRREEVAELAGVGTTWYTWLEQARDIQPSSEVLRRLASALRLDVAEIRHMFSLAGKAPPNEIKKEEEIPSSGLLRVLHESLQVPAIIIGARWDVIAINDLARKELPYVAELAEKHANWIRYIFLSPYPRMRLPEWEMNARRLVGEFRASISELIDNPWVLDMIEELRNESPEFAQWWTEHDVRDNASVTYDVIDEKTGERRSRERVILGALDGSRFKIVLFNPLNVSK